MLSRLSLYVPLKEMAKDSSPMLEGAEDVEGVITGSDHVSGGSR